LICLILGLCGTFLLGGAAAVAGGAVVSLILLYNFASKSFTIPGSLNMGLIRGANMVVGIAAANPEWTDSIHLLQVPVALSWYIVGVTVISTCESDPWASVRLRIGGWICAFAFAIAGWKTGLDAESAPFFVAAAGVIGFIEFSASRFTPNTARMLVRYGLLGIFLFDALVLFTLHRIDAVVAVGVMAVLSFLAAEWMGRANAATA
jgi:4-hydroxybenzoate polyprenyltransferase